MAYTCADPSPYKGKSCGSGQCVDLVKIAANAPQTDLWREGQKVKGNRTISAGTAIATFQSGKYQNRRNGDSHAAIYLRQDSVALYVLDQWFGHPVTERPIWFRSGKSEPRNDGDAFSVIE